MTHNSRKVLNSQQSKKSVMECNSCDFSCSSANDKLTLKLIKMHQEKKHGKKHPTESKSIDIITLYGGIETKRETIIDI